MASGLVGLEKVEIEENKYVGLGAHCLGRLPNLKRLYASTCSLMQDTFIFKTGLSLYWPNS